MAEEEAWFLLTAYSKMQEERDEERIVNPEGTRLKDLECS